MSLPYLAAAIALALATVGAAPAFAQPVTAQQCLAAQLRISGSGCRGIAKCYSKAMKEGSAVSTSCIDLKQDAVKFFIEPVEETAHCLVNGQGDSVCEQMEAGLDEIANDLTLAGGKCAAKKMKALGRACNGFFRCNAAADAASSSLDPECLAPHAARLVDSFAKFDAKGGCATMDDASALQGKVADLVDAVRVVFRGMGTTTTTVGSP